MSLRWPKTLDAVSILVIAAGGVVDRRGGAAALALGAAAIQIGTANLFTLEAKMISEVYRKTLYAPDTPTSITSLFTGRPARGHRQSPDGGSRPAA